MGLGQRYGLEIRAASATDAQGIAALMADLGLGSVEPGLMAGRLDALVRAGGSALIAVEWGPPSGLIALSIVHDLTAARPAGFIATLAVAPDARRRGIGRLLVKAVSRSARLAGCDRLLLPPGRRRLASPISPRPRASCRRAACSSVRSCGGEGARSSPVPGWSRLVSIRLKGRFTPLA